jgi:hypothetical protein
MQSNKHILNDPYVPLEADNDTLRNDVKTNSVFETKISDTD